MRKGFITFADILGWKGIWLKENPKVMAEKLENILQNLRSIITTDNISISLISDTFVIYSSFEENVEQEFEIHTAILLELINLNIEQKLLIRGATSYGEYFVSSQKLTFVGPAIDEAASWHEKADDISIFLTPSALVKVKKFTSIANWVDKELNSKSIKFKTLVLNWKQEKHIKLFDVIFENNSPIIPEISGKYINTWRYLNETE